MNDEEMAKAVNESGFPLQLGIKRLANTGNWRVSLEEHPWRDPLSGDEKFIDLVVRQSLDLAPIRLVIESKRARDTEWIFLREPTSSNDRTRVRARVLTIPESDDNTAIDDWTDVQFVPGTPEANYCVVRKNQQRSQELVEKSAAELIRAIDYLADQEAALYKRRRGGLASPSRGLALVFVPIIVTTAKLFICDADYGGIDLNAGEVMPSSSASVVCVRFTKSFGSINPRDSTATFIKRLSEESERTVLIVNAEAFPELLSKFDLSKRSQLIEQLYSGGVA